LSRTAAATAARMAKRAAQPVVDSFGGRIRTLREAHELTQTELAQRCGITKAALSKIELGHSAGRHCTLVLLADALGVSLADLHA